MPEFPGGQGKLLQFLATSIKYPAEAFEKKEEGRVTLTFIVEKDGSISDIKVARSVSPSLDAEAVRVAKSMPKWTPGKNKDGEIIRIAYTVPVIFRLQ
jgi:TonB family protein